MQITFYKTKTPTDYTDKVLTDARGLNITPRDVVDPYAFNIPVKYAGHWLGYNYAVCAGWGIKYFVDPVLEGDTVILKLTCDSLATFKNDILASTAHVVRSTSNGDAYIADPMVTTKPVTRLVTRKVGAGWGVGDYYILTIGGKIGGGE
jgi:hypothetical protein